MSLFGTNTIAQGAPIAMPSAMNANPAQPFYGGGASMSVPNAISANPTQAFYGAVAKCSIFGDDRDALIARWNLLQASWGFGKICYNQNAPPLPIEQTNPM